MKKKIKGTKLAVSLGFKLFRGNKLLKKFEVIEEESVISKILEKEIKKMYKFPVFTNFCNSKSPLSSLIDISTPCNIFPAILVQGKNRLTTEFYNNTWENEFETAQKILEDLNEMLVEFNRQVYYTPEEISKMFLGK